MLCSIIASMELDLDDGAEGDLGAKLHASMCAPDSAFQRRMPGLVLNTVVAEGVTERTAEERSLVISALKNEHRVNLRRLKMEHKSALQKLRAELRAAFTAELVEEKRGLQREHERMETELCGQLESKHNAALEALEANHEESRVKLVQESGQHVLSLKEERERLQDSLAVAEAALDESKSEVKEARLQYSELGHQLAEKEAYFCTQQQDMRDDAATHKEGKAAAEKALAEALVEKEALSAAQTATKGKLKEVVSRFKALAAQKAACDASLKNLRETAELEARVAAEGMEKALAELAASKEANVVTTSGLQGRVQDLERRNLELVQTVSDLQRSELDLTTAKHELEAQLSEAASEHARKVLNLRRDYDEAREAERREAREQLESVHAQLSSTQDEKAAVVEDHEKTRSKLGKVVSRFRTLKQQKNESDARLSSLGSRLQESANLAVLQSETVEQLQFEKSNFLEERNSLLIEHTELSNAWRLELKKRLRDRFLVTAFTSVERAWRCWITVISKTKAHEQIDLFEKNAQSLETKVTTLKAELLASSNELSILRAENEDHANERAVWAAEMKEQRDAHTAQHKAQTSPKSVQRSTGRAEEHEDSNPSQAQQHEDSVKLLTEEVTSLRTELAVLSGELTSKARAQFSAGQLHQQQQQQQQQASEELSRLQAEHSALKIELRQTKSYLTDTLEQLQAVQDKCDVLQQQHGTTQAEQSALEVSLSEASSAISRLELEKSSACERFENLQVAHTAALSELHAEVECTQYELSCTKEERVLLLESNIRLAAAYRSRLLKRVQSHMLNAVQMSMAASWHRWASELHDSRELKAMVRQGCNRISSLEVGRAFARWLRSTDERHRLSMMLMHCERRFRWNSLHLGWCEWRNFVSQSVSAAHAAALEEVECSAARAAQGEVVRRTWLYMSRAAHCSLRLGWHRWARFVAAGYRSDTLLSNVRSRRGLVVARCMVEGWCAFVGRRRRLRQTVLHLASRARFSRLLAGWRSWQAALVEAMKAGHESEVGALNVVVAGCEQRAVLCVTRMYMLRAARVLVHSAWRVWVDEVSNSRLVEASLGRARARLSSLRGGRAFSSWCSLVQRRVRVRELLCRASRGKERQLVELAWRAWGLVVRQSLLLEYRHELSVVDQASAEKDRFWLVIRIRECMLRVAEGYTMWGWLRWRSQVQQLKLHDMRAQVSEVTASHATLSAEFSESVYVSETLGNELQLKKEECSALVANVQDQVARHIFEMECLAAKQVTQEKAMTDLKIVNDELSSETHRLAEEFRSVSAELLSRQDAFGALREEHTKLQGQHASLTTLHATVDDELAAARGGHFSLQLLHDEVSTQLSATKAEQVVTEEKYSALFQQHEIVASELRQMESKQTELKASMQIMEVDKVNADAELNLLQERVTSLEEEANQFQTMKEEAATLAVEELRSALTMEHKAALQSVKNEHQELLAELTSWQENKAALWKAEFESQVLHLTERAAQLASQKELAESELSNAIAEAEGARSIAEVCKREAASAIKQAQVNLEDTGMRLKDTENEVTALRAQVLRHRAREIELTKENGTLQELEHKKDLKKITLSSQLEVVRRDLLDVKTERIKLTSQLNEMRASQQSYQTQHQDIQEQLKKVKAENELLQSNHQQDSKRADQDKCDERVQAEQNKNYVKLLTGEITGLRIEVAGLNGELTKVKAEFSAGQQHEVLLQQQQQQASEELSRLQAEHSALKIELRQTKSYLTDTLEQLQAVQDKCDVLQQQHGTTQAEQSALEVSLSEASSAISRLELEKSSACERFENLQVAHTAALSELHAEVECTQYELSCTKEERVLLLESNIRLAAAYRSRLLKRVQSHMLNAVQMSMAASWHRWASELHDSRELKAMVRQGCNRISSLEVGRAFARWLRSTDERHRLSMMLMHCERRFRWNSLHLGWCEWRNFVSQSVSAAHAAALEEVECSAARAAQGEVVRRTWLYMSRAAHCSLRLGWHRWARFVAAGYRSDTLLSNVRSRRGLVVARCMVEGWCAFVGRRRRLRQTVLHLASRARFSRLLAGWRSWQAALVEAMKAGHESEVGALNVVVAGCEQRAVLCVTRMYMLRAARVLVHSAWRVWVDEVSNSRLVEASLGRARARLSSLRGGRAFSSWCSLVQRRVRVRELLCRASRGKERQLVELAWRAWGLVVRQSLLLEYRHELSVVDQASAEKDRFWLVIRIRECMLRVAEGYTMWGWLRWRSQVQQLKLHDMRAQVSEVTASQATLSSELISLRASCSEMELLRPELNASQIQLVSVCSERKLLENEVGHLRERLEFFLGKRMPSFQSQAAVIDEAKSAKEAIRTSSVRGMLKSRPDALSSVTSQLSCASMKSVNSVNSVSGETWRTRSYSSVICDESMKQPLINDFFQEVRVVQFHL